MNDKEIIEEIVEEFGRSLEIWGFPKVIGKVWAILYFKDGMTQETLKEEMGCGLSSISQSISVLENLGLVCVTGREGRKKIYTAEKSFQKIKRKKLEAALRYQIEPMVGMLDSRLDMISNKTLKNRVKEIKDQYSKTGRFLKLILKLPFGK